MKSEFTDKRETGDSVAIINRGCIYTWFEILRNPELITIFKQGNTKNDKLLYITIGMTIAATKRSINRPHKKGVNHFFLLASVLGWLP